MVSFFQILLCYSCLHSSPSEHCVLCRHSLGQGSCLCPSSNSSCGLLMPASWRLNSGLSSSCMALRPGYCSASDNTQSIVLIYHSYSELLCCLLCVSCNIATCLKSTSSWAHLTLWHPLLCLGIRGAPWCWNTMQPEVCRSILVL